MIQSQSKLGDTKSVFICDIDSDKHQYNFILSPQSSLMLISHPTKGTEHERGTEVD
jgi:hypothetical protein